MAKMPAYDVIVSAFGGLLGCTGTQREPAKVGVALTDVCSGLGLLAGVCAALVQRERSGVGCHVRSAACHNVSAGMCVFWSLLF